MKEGELQFVRWLRERCQTSAPQVKLGIGDDMAILQDGESSILVTSDMLLDGVHFDSTQQTWADIGRKAVACSLSDCAAMAVKPLAAVVSLVLSDAISEADAKAIYEGMMGISEEFACPIVGGDTNSWPKPTAIDISMLAVPYLSVPPVTRTGAKPGDRLFVTGRLGGSILGRHLRFQPRVEEARRVAHGWGDHLHAMIDISDGLSLDLFRLCEASGVGADLQMSLLESVIHDDARALAMQDGQRELDHVLSDGEDFELLMAADPQCDPAAAKVELFPIGRVVDDPMLTLRLVADDGQFQPIQPRGYEHLR